MATVVVTQPSTFPDINAARITAAKTVTPTASTAIGTRFEGQSNEAPSAAFPTGRSFISVAVDPAAVTAAAAAQ